MLIEAFLLIPAWAFTFSFHTSIVETFFHNLPLSQTNATPWLGVNYLLHINSTQKVNCSHKNATNFRK